MRPLLLALPLIALAACSRPKPEAVLLDPALSILVPPDTVFLLAVDVEKLKETPVYQKHLASRSVPQMDEVARYTGIDPRKDLWQVLFASDGKNNVLLARGKFDPEMETKLERDGATVIPYRAYHLVGSPEASVVFLNTSTAALGSLESLKRFLDARGKTNGPPPAIAERMKNIPYGSQVWAAYIGGSGKLPVRQGNAANILRVLDTVGAATVYFDLREGFKGTAQGSTASETEGKQLNDALKGMIGLGRLSAPENRPELLRALDGLRVTQEGSGVRLQIEESAEMVEKLLAFVESR